MTRTHLLSPKQRLAEVIRIAKQDGWGCYGCSFITSLEDESVRLDHLNDDPTCDEYWNHGLLCVSCNKKKHNDYDLKIKAKEKIRENLGRVSLLAEDDTATQKVSSEISIHKIVYRETKKYLSEHLAVEEKIRLNRTVNEIVFHCNEKFGCGSDSSIRRAIEAQACHDQSPYIIWTDPEDSQKYLRKREGN